MQPSTRTTLRIGEWRMVPLDAAIARLLWAGATVLFGLLVSAFFLHKWVPRSHPPSAATTPLQTSLAVIPFLDLTDGMKNQAVADRLTYELINRLSNIPGLYMPPAAASLSFQNKPSPSAEMAKSLGVAYVLDGSVRRTGPRLRVAARLVRADDGYVLWSETYDRPVGDLLMVQDDIAGDVTRALAQPGDAQP